MRSSSTSSVTWMVLVRSAEQARHSVSRSQWSKIWRATPTITSWLSQHRYQLEWSDQELSFRKKESDQDDPVIRMVYSKWKQNKNKPGKALKLLLNAHDLLPLGTAGTEHTREGWNAERADSSNGGKQNLKERRGEGGAGIRQLKGLLSAAHQEASELS